MRTFAFVFVSLCLLSFIVADSSNTVYLDCGSPGSSVAPVKVSLKNTWHDVFTTNLVLVKSEPTVNKYTLALDSHAELVALDFSSMSSSYDGQVSISISPMNWKCVGGWGSNGCGSLDSTGFRFVVMQETTQTILLSWNNAQCSTLISATRGKIAPPLLATLSAETQAFNDLVFTPAFAPTTLAYSVALPNFQAPSSYSIYITSAVNSAEYTVSCSLINVPTGDKVSQVVLQPANSATYTALLTLASTTPSLQVVFSVNQSPYTSSQATTYTLAFTSSSTTQAAAPLTFTSFIDPDNVVSAGNAAPFMVKIVENKP